MPSQAGELRHRLRTAFARRTSFEVCPHPYQVDHGSPERWRDQPSVPVPGPLTFGADCRCSPLLVSVSWCQA